MQSDKRIFSVRSTDAFIADSDHLYGASILTGKSNGHAYPCSNLNGFTAQLEQHERTLSDYDTQRFGGVLHAAILPLAK